MLRGTHFLSLSWARLILSTHFYLISLRLVSVFSTQLRLLSLFKLPLPFIVSDKIVYAVIISPSRATCLVHISSIICEPLIISGKNNSPLNFSLYFSPNVNSDSWFQIDNSIIQTDTTYASQQTYKRSNRLWADWPITTPQAKTHLLQL